MPVALLFSHIPTYKDCFLHSFGPLESLMDSAEVAGLRSTNTPITGTTDVFTFSQVADN